MKPETSEEDKRAVLNPQPRGKSQSTTGKTVIARDKKRVPIAI